MRLTLDTNCVDDAELLAVAAYAGAEVAVFSVTRREAAGSHVAAHVHRVIVLPEQSVWADGLWADGFWADRVWASAPAIDYLAKDGSPRKGDPFEDVLSVVSSGSFPVPGARRNLTDGQRNQYRDAMILSLHAQHGRDILVSNDTRAFVKHGRREVLERMLRTRIVTSVEAVALLRGQR
jgi:hypothetical protein